MTKVAERVEFKVQLVHKNAKAPFRATDGAAGYDLYSSEDVTIPAKGGRHPVEIGLKMQIPNHLYGRVAARSGLALRHGIDATAGVIDSDYRGLVKILLVNNGEADFDIKAGDRIAQLILEKIETPVVTVVAELDDLETKRGSGGFGSTGGFGDSKKHKNNE